MAWANVGGVVGAGSSSSLSGSDSWEVLSDLTLSMMSSVESEPDVVTSSSASRKRWRSSSSSGRLLAVRLALSCASGRSSSYLPVMMTSFPIVLL